MPPGIPKGSNAGALADWAELTLLGDESRTLSHARIAKLLRGESSDAADEELEDRLETSNGVESGGEVAPDGPQLTADEADGNTDLRAMGEEAEMERDLRVEFLLTEIELRETLGAKVYPFRAGDDRVEEAEVCGQEVYFLLLILSSSDASYRKQRRAHEVEKVYDLVALEALKRYLGRGADGVRFVQNSHDPADETTRPKNFDEAVGWLRHRDRLDVGPGNREPPEGPEEPHWESDPGAPAGNPILSSYNDGGADVVVWWKFKDNRRGSPVLLAQCTVQLTWENKLEDIHVLWEKWIDFSMVPAQRALVIPFADTPREQLWENRSTRAGVIIDRIRLLELLNEVECEVLENLIDDGVRTWVQTELASLQ